MVEKGVRPVGRDSRSLERDKVSIDDVLAKTISSKIGGADNHERHRRQELKEKEAEQRRDKEFNKHRLHYHP